MASSARSPIATRRPTNISLDAALIAEARALGVNISRACERGLADQVAEARKAQWLAENGSALASSNAHVERHGLPLAASRLF
jgi:antitoxin CcdA